MKENWIKVAAAVDVPEDGTLLVNLGAEPVCLYKLAGKIFATHDTCTHGQASLADGFIEGTCVTCPWHGWQLDVTTGRHCLNPRIEHARFPLKFEGDDVFVELP